MRCACEGGAWFTVFEAIRIFHFDIVPIEMTDELFRVRAFDIPQDEFEGIFVCPVIAAGRLERGQADVMAFCAGEEAGAGAGRFRAGPLAVAEGNGIATLVVFDRDIPYSAVPDVEADGLHFFWVVL